MKLYLTLCVALMMIGCGKPNPADAPIRASMVMDFETLYATRCAGCHGNQGTGSGSIALNDAAYLSLIGKLQLRELIRDGRAHSLMPSFQANSGDPLTDAQIDVLVVGITKRWSSNPPDWAHQHTYAYNQGDPMRGRGAFIDMCGTCHGQNGFGGTAGAVTNPMYLNLVSDQYLRTVVLCGRPELGMPAMGGQTDDQTVNDIVAWLASHRLAEGNVR